MKITTKSFVSFLVFSFSILNISAQDIYFPETGTWEEKDPKSFNLDFSKAIEFAEANEYSESKDLRQAILKGFQHEPYHEILGPTKRRGGPAGMILKDGYLVAQWGDIKRVDMTFSVTKSFLSTTALLALDKNLIVDVEDPVINYIWDDTF